MDDRGLPSVLLVLADASAKFMLRSKPPESGIWSIENKRSAVG